MNEVREMRLAAGLTQAGLTERSGVAQPNLAAYESGRRRPSATMLARLQEAAPPRPSVVLARHRDEIVELAHRHGAEDVRVFGSVARGADVSGHGLDLLVRFDEDADLYDLADLVAALEELTDLSVNVVSDGGIPPGAHPVRDEAVRI